MVRTAVIQQVEAAPKDQKTTSHCKETLDHDTQSYEVKCGINSNGPDGHSNLKYSYSTSDYDSRCIPK